MNTSSIKLVGLAAGMALLNACSPSLQQAETASSSAPLYSPQPANLRISLEDAPNDNLTNVFVSINRMELWLEKNGVEKRLVLPNNFGTIDLLTLQNGVRLPFEDVDMPQGVAVKQIRIILNSNGHSAVKNDGSVCELSTPSAQQSGIKILINQPIVFENDHSYSMVVDFDAKKSVVQMGNGGCLLKPVLKLESATKIPSDQVDDDGNSSLPGDDLLDGEIPINDELNDGFDPADPSTWPEGVTEENLHNYL